MKRENCRFAVLFAGTLVAATGGCSTEREFSERMVVMSPPGTLTKEFKQINALMRDEVGPVEGESLPGLQLLGRQLDAAGAGGLKTIAGNRKSLSTRKVPPIHSGEFRRKAAKVAQRPLEYAEEDPLPRPLAESELFRKTFQSLEAQKPATGPDGNSGSEAMVRTSSKEIRELMAALPKALGELEWKSATRVGDPPKVRLVDIAKEYLVAYYMGEFVDRRGVKLEKPKISTEIGNETIANFLIVLAEATGDFAFPTGTAFASEGEKRKYFNQTGEAPTCVKVFQDLYDYDLSIEVADGGPITEREARMIAYLSGLSADQTKALWGLLLRLFGGADIGPIVLFGRINIGDNEVLTASVTALLETVARRGTERVAFKYFLTN